MKRASVLSVIVAAWAVGCGGDASETATQEEALIANANPGVAPPWSWPYLRSYEQWEVEWWQWSMRVPAARDPIRDTTGEHCAEGQHGPVWFLAGTWGGAVRRECTIPRGKALYFPVVNQIWVQMLTDPPSTLREMREYTREAVRGVRMSATIDGREVLGLTRYYEETPVFSAMFGADNSWGVTAENCPARRGMFVCNESVDAGYSLFLYPLPPGDHTIHFDATMTNGFALDVTYTLHVR